MLNGAQRDAVICIWNSNIRKHFLLERCIIQFVYRMLTFCVNCVIEDEKELFYFNMKPS
jgi:hypothetical protein